MGPSKEKITSTDNIIKSPEDKREYRALELKNRMKVLLVSDPDTDKSAAALDVNVGSASDPKKLQGLAHFCEHMTFLGTGKYPNEDDYHKYLSAHGGSHNACTGYDHTIYFFDVVPEYLRSALDRFVQFFLSPLFTSSATEREVMSVNLEHEKNIPHDGYRMRQIYAHTANPSHPFYKFGTGNMKTLQTIPKMKNIDVRQELLVFHKTWYSANLMTLVVIGKESLDDLEKIIIELFSEVVDKNVPPPIWEENPLKDEYLRKITYVVPIRDVRSLEIHFPFPDLYKNYKSYPAEYLAHLIGHEGPGSLLAAFKEKGWCSYLTAGDWSPNRGVAFFMISVDLSEDGLLHVTDIIKMIFQYIILLKKTGPLLWVHEENCHIKKMEFRFLDKETPIGCVLSAVTDLHYYPFEHVLCRSYICEWIPELITEVLDALHPKNMKVYLTAQQYEAIANLKEPWYGTNYNTIPIEEDVLNDWINAGLNEELHIPHKNLFIPENFDLYPQEFICEFPELIKNSNLSKVWFKQDNTFLLPKCDIIFHFTSPLTYLDPLNCNLTRMFTQLFYDDLNKYAYDAEMAGLSWRLSDTDYGLQLDIGEYNDKQYTFLEKIMDTIINFKIDPKRFAVLKDNYIRDLQNFAADEPYQHSSHYMDVLLTDHCWSKYELLEVSKDITIGRIQDLIIQMFTKMTIFCLIHGNITKDKALDLVQLVENKILSVVEVIPLLHRQWLLDTERKLEDNSSYLYEVEVNVHSSSCVDMYLQCGKQNTKMNVLLELFVQIIEQPCFNILRTKEQLGYMVWVTTRRWNGVQGLNIVVQSDKHPRLVESRIEDFLQNMFSYLNNMTDEEYKKQVESLVAQKLEKPKQLSTLTAEMWAEIEGQQFFFGREQVEVAMLRTVKKEELIEFYEQYIRKGAKYRRKLAIHVISNVLGGAGSLVPPDLSLGDTILIRNVTEFKRQLGTYGLVEPYTFYY